MQAWTDQHQSHRTMMAYILLVCISTRITCQQKQIGDMTMPYFSNEMCKGNQKYLTFSTTNGE